MAKEYEGRYADLYNTDLGKAMLKAEEYKDQLVMTKKANQIGEEVITRWNPKSLTEKIKKEDGTYYVNNPFAEAISNEFLSAVEKAMPNNQIRSAQFESWINRTHNELISDTKFKFDNYAIAVIKQREADSGVVDSKEPNAKDIVMMKIEILKNEIDKHIKAFQTFMNHKPEQAFASLETLQKWDNYYKAKAQEVDEALKNNNFEAYKRGEKEGTKEDATRHQENIKALQEQINKAAQEQQNRMKNESKSQSQNADNVQLNGETYKPPKPKF